VVNCDSFELITVPMISSRFLSKVTGVGKISSILRENEVSDTL